MLNFRSPASIELESLKSMTIRFHVAAFSDCSLRAILAGVLLLGICGQISAQDIDRGRYQTLQQQISELEQTLGSYDPALLENLVALADTATGLNLYSEASSLLDRAIQIQRFNYGLFTAEQVPLYFELLESQIRADNWAAANASLDHVYWLLLEKRVNTEVSVVDNLLRMSAYHLLAVSADDPGEQADHYREAEDLTYMALRLSEAAWGPSDPRRIPIYYSLIKQFYLQATAIERVDTTGYALRGIVPGSRWVVPKRISRARYHRAGLRLFADLQRKFSDSGEGSAELGAMIELYRADWHLLFDRDDAEDAYKEAYDALRAAQVDAGKLERFLARPRIIPVPVLYVSVDADLAATESAGSRGADSESATAATTASAMEHLFHFQEWFEAMPFVSFPETAPITNFSPGPEGTAILLRFRLDSLNPVSRWVGGTYQTHRGVANEFELLEAPDNPPIDSGLLNRRLHAVHFRPRLEDGIPQPFESTLRYYAVFDSSE